MLQNFIVTTGDTIIGDGDTGSDGGDVEIEGGDATVASGGDAGDVIIRPGLPDGIGDRGIVNVTNNGGDDSVPVLQLTSEGANAEDIRLMVGTRDPSATVSGNPGDIYVRHNGTSSSLKINTGAVDANTTWTDLAQVYGVAGLPGNIYQSLVCYIDSFDRNSYPGTGATVTDILGNATAGSMTDVAYINGAFLFMGTQVWQVDVSAGNNAFVDESIDFQDADAAGDWQVFPGTDAVGDYAAIGRPATFTSMTLNSTGGTAGVGGSVVWEYWNGAAWASLAGVVDGTTGFTAALGAGQVVSWTLPSDWAPLELAGSAPLYYVRARILVIYSTNPNYSNGFVQDTESPRISFTKGTAVDNIFAGGGSVVAFIRPNGSGLTTAGRVVDTTDSLDEGWYVALTAEVAQRSNFRFQRNFTGTDGNWTSDNIVSPVDAVSYHAVYYGEWSCIGVAYDDSSIATDPSMYWNGRLLTNSQSGIPSGTAVSDVGNSLLIGNNTSLTTTFDGSIGVVLLFDRMLTAIEMRAVYNAFAGRFGLGQYGRDGYIRTGQSIWLTAGSTTSNNSDANGGDIVLQGGNRAALSGSARAGNIVIRGGSLGGTGGTSGGDILIESGANTAGSSSSVTIRCGDAGGSASAGGDLTLLAANPTAGNAPGNVVIRGGSPTTAVNTNGGTVTVQGGHGRSASGAGGVGGDIFIRGGGVANSTGGTTGDINLLTQTVSPFGGATTATGAITISTAGGGASMAASGNVSIICGNTNATSGSNPGDMLLQGATQSNATQANATAGNITLTAGGNAGAANSVGGSVAITAGTVTNTGATAATGGDITLTAGGNAHNSAASRAGNITLQAGNGTGTNTSGGSISLTSGAATGAGSTAGALTLTAGAGAAALIGGTATVIAGAGGATGTGGSLTLAAGAGGATSGAGGNALLRGGTATTSGNGGSVSITGQNGATTGTGGSVTLTAGTGAGGSADGSIVLASAFCWNNVISPAALAAGDTPNYAPTGIGSANVIRLTGDAGGTSALSGITPVTTTGRVILLCNISAFNIQLTHDATSTAANRFLCPGSGNLVIPADGSRIIWYDATSARWRVQGAVA
jgi:hypothetical protein